MRQTDPPIWVLLAYLVIIAATTGVVVVLAQFTPLWAVPLWLIVGALAASVAIICLLKRAGY